MTGCATGEEAYTVAMLLIEQAEAAQKGTKVLVFATDFEIASLEIARAGLYPTGAVAVMSPERLRRFFIQEEDHFRVTQDLRDAVVFAAQNLLSDPPFSRLDLVTCRNVLIYLEPDVQGSVIALFHFALRPGGFLFLGASETIGPHDDVFETISKKWQVYRRVGPMRLDKLEFSTITPGSYLVPARCPNSPRAPRRARADSSAWPSGWCWSTMPQPVRWSTAGTRSATSAARPTTTSGPRLAC